MHQTRRRKKRPSYGVRTVELSRGKKGFGFTISGQAPCILSCIVANSPAERVGLRPGDFLVAVNGRNVSRAPHDDVVRLIGSSIDVLQLQIAENYYSDSSEDEAAATPGRGHHTRPRHRHVPRLAARDANGLFPPSVSFLSVSIMYRDQIVVFIPGGVPFGILRWYSACLLEGCPNQHTKCDLASVHPSEACLTYGVTLAYIDNWNRDQLICTERRSTNALHCVPGVMNTPITVPSIQACQGDSNKALLDLILQQKARRTPPRANLVVRTVVGYLGTIELPREVAGSRLQAIRSCVRRLRLEQKVHTLVLLSVLRDGVVLADLQGAALARFPAERIAFSGAYADDSRFLGLVTRGADGALSCHVLMVDARLRLPPGGLRVAPLHESAEPILRAVAALYRRSEGGANASPQPSQAGSNSSNSDSGIGFRDEGNVSDRVLVVDMESQPHFQSLSLDRQGALPLRADPERLRVRAMPDPVGLEWAGDALLDDTLTADDPCLDGESLDLQSSTKGEDGSSSATPRRNESSCSSRKNWTRSSSLRRHQRRSHHRRNTREAGTVSDGEVPSEKLSMSSSVQSLDQASDSSSSCDQPRGRVGRWLVGFDGLLHDPLGLLVFAEFLKKEFSQENIFFWVVCEQYRKMLDSDERKMAARDIYQKHLALGAPEPVNVDSRAQQEVREGLEEAAPDLFVPAQKQILNLMKFDCYQRFLKSDLLKQCMLREVQGQPVLPELQEDKLRKEDKRRRSFLPWHKKKYFILPENQGPYSYPVEGSLLTNGCHVLDLKLVGSKLGERAAWARKSSKKKTVPKPSTDLASSRSSLASSEASLGLLCSASREVCRAPNTCGQDTCVLSRIVLPDGSSTVVRMHRGETVGAMLTLLLQKRSLNYSAVDVFVAGSDKPVNPSVDVTLVGCKEIRVEPRVVFCVMLPNSKMLGVKAAPRRSCGDVLRPVLAKYGVQLDHITLRTFPVQGLTMKAVSASTPVGDVDNQHIVVQFKENGSENRGALPLQLLPHGESVVRRFLDAIHDGKVHFDELGVTDLDILFPPVVEVRQCAEGRGVLLPCRGALSSMDKSPLAERLAQKDAGPKSRDDGPDPRVCRELLRGFEAPASPPPPPLPPKAKQRGPPPRPPSRPSGGYPSEDDDLCLPLVGSGEAQVHRGDLAKLIDKTKKASSSHDCNISFV
ncbi:unnamed protein product [Ixodes hexagonus]